jgi:hypothetical protein
MRHPRLLSLGSLAALGLLIGCDESSPVSPSPASPSPLASESRPWKESYQSTGTIAPGGRCAPLLLVSLQGGGTATHIGKYTIVNSHCVNPETGELTSGTFVKVAANGDRIRGSYGGNAIPTGPGTFNITGTITFEGGTGRFANASGTTSMTGTLNADFSQSPAPAQVQLEMLGTISY